MHAKSSTDAGIGLVIAAVVFVAAVILEGVVTALVAGIVGFLVGGAGAMYLRNHRR